MGFQNVYSECHQICNSTSQLIFIHLGTMKNSKIGTTSSLLFPQRLCNAHSAFPSPKISSFLVLGNTRLDQESFYSLSWALNLYFHYKATYMCCVLTHFPNVCLQQLCCKDIIILFLFYCVKRKASHLKNVWFHFIF